MKVDLIRYNKTSGESVTAFYKRYRAFFVKNLWKTGEFIKAKNACYTEDEKITYTLGNIIVYMALREIDSIPV